MRFRIDLLNNCWFLAGPTACGKTAVGLELAQALPVEIVSMDSMAIYRRMDIGTAKPSTAEQQRVPHHLIDIVDPHQEFSVAEFLTAAESACEQIIARGLTPLFVGGTGLYLRSLLRGTFDGPEADWDFRTRMQQELKDHGAAGMFERLRQQDPQTAGRLHPNDHRRLVRALEVIHLTGKPLSEQQQQDPLPADQRPRNVYWLRPPRKWLYQRINDRVQNMLQIGLLEEVQRLLAEAPPLSRTAQQALGYRELIDHLQGKLGYAEAVTVIQNRTRQFAKRQHTWYRNLVECLEFQIQAGETSADIADRLLQHSES